MLITSFLTHLSSWSGFSPLLVRRVGARDALPEKQQEGERRARAFGAGGGQHPLAMEDDHSGLVRNHLSLSNDGPKDVSSIKAADRTVCLTSLINAESALTPGAEALIRLVGLRHAQEKDEQFVRERIVQARLRE